MSFSKAKLKRFNEISENTPKSGQMTFVLKDFKDLCTLGELKDKNTKSPKKMAIKDYSVAENSFYHQRSKSKLFRTPSLPKRFKFRQNTNLNNLNTEKQLRKTPKMSEVNEVSNSLKYENPQIAQTNERSIFGMKNLGISKKNGTKKLMNDIITLTNENQRLKDENINWKITYEECDKEKADYKSKLEFENTINTEAEIKYAVLLEENNLLKNKNAVLSQELFCVESDCNILQTIKDLNDDIIMEKNNTLENITAQKMFLLEKIKLLQNHIDKNKLSFGTTMDTFSQKINCLKNQISNLIGELKNNRELVTHVKNLYSKISDNCITSSNDPILLSFGINKLFDILIDCDEILELKCYENLENNKENFSSPELSKQNNNNFQMTKKNLDVFSNKFHHCNLSNEEVKKNGICSNETFKSVFTHPNQSQNFERDIIESSLQTALSFQDYIDMFSKLEFKIKTVKHEYSKMKIDKFNYQVTLTNTRSTVNILMERLKKSDNDVEALKTELEIVNRKKYDLEIKHVSLEKRTENIMRQLRFYKRAFNALQNFSYDDQQV